MKTILKTLFIIIASMLIFSFTTNNEKKKEYKPINQITTDARFISLLQEEYTAMDNVTNIDALKNYDTDNLNDNDINNIASLLGYSSTSAYVNSLNAKRATINELNDEYNLNSYSTDQLIELGVTALQGNKSRNKAYEGGGEIIPVEPIGKDDPCDCKRKRRNCIAAAAAAAFAGHLGCAALDVTVIAGLACHAAVAIAQAAATDNCHIEYKECIKNCKE